MNLKLPLLFGLPFLLPVALRAAEPMPEEADFFEKKVRPVLVEHCYSCHSAEAKKVKGGLRVDSREALLAGGGTGAAIAPGQPEKSRLIEAISYKNVDLQMPPKARLPDTAIADLTTWVKKGAPWPGSGKTVEVVKESFDLQQRKARHWAWQPIVNPPVPEVKNKEWFAHPIDRFLLAKMEEKGLRPAERAEPNVILRRLFFDIIGLPPSPGDLVEFEKEFAATPQAAMKKVVDRLLESPQYGERWARHWLDLVRYAESRGHEFDPTIPNAYQYRDYVIRALNFDVPYNQFVEEHIAGDLLPTTRLNPTEKFNESVLGTGFWHFGEEVHSPVDIRADEADRFDNRIDVFSKTFLALTVSCARCHDHKFDAISQKDYYALYGFLRSSSYRQVRFDTDEHNRPVLKALNAVEKKHRPSILRAFAKLMKPGVESMPKWVKAAQESMRTGAPSDDPIVREWVTYLEAAKKNPKDPFHSAACGLEKDAPRPFDIGETIGADGQVLLDFTQTEPGSPSVISDAPYAYRVYRTGEVRLRTHKDQPLPVFQERGCAEINLPVLSLTEAPGTQADHGPLGASRRAGRILYTPKFTIRSGQIHLLVRGNFRSYVAVDGHTVIAGPLHASLIRNFDTKGEWKWVTHDLSAYKGHLAHVELSPIPAGELGTPFAVAKVVEGTPVLNKGDTKAAKGTGLDGWDGLTFQQKCEKTLAGIEAGALEDHAPGEVANWMRLHAALLGVHSWQTVVEAYESYREEREQMVANLRRESRLAPTLIDGTAHDEHVFIRGSHKAPGEVVPRRFLEALAGSKGIESKGSGRLELARQMTDPSLNPFITRVIVNRVWHHLFGRGIVASTDNFGELGERPTHPELLDYLAKRFADEGWSIKKLIRELALTRAYQMSSRPDPATDLIDPENLLLHRMRLRRLEGEAIRDAMLAVSGRLDPKLYGPPVPVHLTPFLDGRGKPASGPVDGDGRRSLYIAVRRNFLSPMMLAFDSPSPFSTVGRRTVSNVPAQALILMNDPFVHLMAEAWGKRMAEDKGDQDSRIERMFRQAFGRAPTAQELADCRQYLTQQAIAGKNDGQAWGALAHVLFNVKEFIFVE